MTPVPIAIIAAGISQLLDEGEDARPIFDELARDHGARLRFAHGTYEMRLGGVTATCTAGEKGLLRNWVAAVRRRLDRDAAQ